MPLSTRPANSTDFAGLVDLVEYELNPFRESLKSIAVFDINESLHFDRSSRLKLIEKKKEWAFVETTFSRPLEISFKLSENAASWPIKALKVIVVPEQIDLAHRNASIEGERRNGFYRACAMLEVVYPTLLNSTNAIYPNNSSLVSPTRNEKICSGHLNYQSRIYIRVADKFFKFESKSPNILDYELPDVEIFLNPRMRSYHSLSMDIVNSKASDPRLIKFVQVEMDNPTATLLESGSPWGPGLTFFKRIFGGDTDVGLNLYGETVTFKNELEFSNSTLQLVKDTCCPFYKNEGLFVVVSNRSLERIASEFPGKIKIFQDEGECPITISKLESFETGSTDFELEF